MENSTTSYDDICLDISSQSRTEQRSTVEVLEFNEEQKAAMAAALMAVAEEVACEAASVPQPLQLKKEPPPAKNPPLRSGDVIDLLSDSETDSECEILGYLDSLTNEPIAGEELQLFPKEFKVEVKEEQTEEWVNEIPATDLPLNDVYMPAAVDASSEELITDHIGEGQIYQERAQNYTLPLDKPDFLISNVAEGTDPCYPLIQIIEDAVGVAEAREEVMPTPIQVKLPFVTAETTEQPTSTSAATLRSFRPFQGTKGEKGNGGGHDQRLSTSQEVVTSDTDSAYEGNSGDLIMPGPDDASNNIVTQLVDENLAIASTFGTDNYDCDNSMEEASTSTGSRRATRNGGRVSTPLDDDIIELDNSSDDEMDEETETKLIDLIVSDTEEQTQDAHTNGDGTTVTNGSEKPTAGFGELLHYFCPECNFPCGTIQKWRAHTHSEHDFRSLSKLNVCTIVGKEGTLCHQCKTCYKKYNMQMVTFGKLFEHRLTHMPFPNYLKCRLCDKRFPNRIAGRRHLINSHEKICRHYLKRPSSAQQHIQFFCPVCGQQQTNRQRQKKHLNDKHDFYASVEDRVRMITENVYECRECEKTFRKSRAKEHCLLHEKHYPYKCKLCDDFSAKQLNYAMTHVRESHLQGGKKYYRCIYCDAKFERGTERGRHLREKHHIRKQRLQCEVCERSFTSSSMLLSHISTSNHQKLK